MVSVSTIFFNAYIKPLLKKKNKLGCTVLKHCQNCLTPKRFIENNVSVLITN